MTREEILRLTPGRELDMLVETKIMQTKKPPKGFYINPLHYSEDISAVWRAEQKIEKRKLLSRYVIALMKVVGVENRCPFSDIEMFSFIHASPADRCKAALLAVLEEDDK